MKLMVKYDFEMCQMPHIFLKYTRPSPPQTVNFPFFNKNVQNNRPEIAPMFGTQTAEADAKIVTFTMFCDIFIKIDC
jgi:hypothetical protein